MSYSLLGWLNVMILSVLLAPFILTRLNKQFFGSKNRVMVKTSKYLRKYHKQLGILLVFLSLYHGFLALGAIRLHTGTVLFLAILSTVILGGSFYRLKKKNILSYHRIFSGLVFLLLLIHIFFPYAFS